VVWFHLLEENSMKPLERPTDLSSNASRRQNEQRRHVSFVASADHGLDTFLSLRARLFGIAYRMLGSAAEAEDVVQNVWVRWQTTDRTRVRDAAAFLVTTATRLAINVRQSARSRREMSSDPSQSEPIDARADPRLGTERRQALASGVLLLLERLTPTERAAYILREAFDYRYREIGDVLRLEEANARQIVTRARRHVVTGRRMAATPTEQTRVLDAFVAAADRGDIAALEESLCPQRRWLSTRPRAETAQSSSQPTRFRHAGTSQAAPVSGHCSGDTSH
jgi:RNA polymerase sigma factor (sigma-70 family)